MNTINILLRDIMTLNGKSELKGSVKWMNWTFLVLLILVLLAWLVSAHNWPQTIQVWFENIRTSATTIPPVSSAVPIS